MAENEFGDIEKMDKNRKILDFYDFKIEPKIEQHLWSQIKSCESGFSIRFENRPQVLLSRVGWFRSILDEHFYKLLSN